MNVEHAVLNVTDNIICDICILPVKYDIVGVTCCNSVFHGECLRANMDHSQICPKCEEMFKINIDNPLLTKLSQSTTKTNVNEIYCDIYQHNPEALKIIDQALRARGSKVGYHENFKGYFPYSVFHKNFDMDDFHRQWNIFSYGLLTDYDWAHTTACGRAVWEITKNHSIKTNDEHVYIVIYNRDYRIVRSQLKRLFQIIEQNCTNLGFLRSDLTVYIQDGILVASIRGIVRKICICVEYNDDPFWIIYKSKKYFNAYGSLYDGRIVEMSVKALVNNKAPEYPVLSSLDYVMGYGETKDHYAKRIGYGIGSFSFLFREVYPNYKFRISLKCVN